MKPTPEKQAILDHIKDHEGLTLISSIAGSGKTTILTMIAEQLDPKSGLYLAYTKAVATEASAKFPEAVHCCTTHSLAYQATVKAYGLKIGQFSYRDVKSFRRYEDRQAVVDLFREFCLSSHTEVKAFLKSVSMPEKYAEPIDAILAAMESGKQECTHDFYLKLFHVLLANGTLKYDPLDLLMLDEAGDLNEVTLAIFRLIPSVRSVLVGDPMQNIFAFNHTIDCFGKEHKDAKLFPMSQSFRTSSDIADRIQAFCRQYLDPTMDFRGVTLKNKTIKTRGFIARTNAALIGKMIELNTLGIPYGLTRTPKQLFTLPLSLCNLKYKGFIADPSIRHLQADVDDYYEEPALRREYRSVLAYIKDLHQDDIVIQQTTRLILKHGARALRECYESALKHSKKKQPYILGTAHSTKGLEFDEVTIADDLNKVISNILSAYPHSIAYTDYLPEEITEFKLYYVACSRAKKVLNNATHLLD